MSTDALQRRMQEATERFLADLRELTRDIALEELRNALDVQAPVSSSANSTADRTTSRSAIAPATPGPTRSSSRQLDLPLRAPAPSAPAFDLRHATASHAATPATEAPLPKPRIIPPRRRRTRRTQDPTPTLAAEVKQAPKPPTPIQPVRRRRQSPGEVQHLLRTHLKQNPGARLEPSAKALGVSLAALEVQAEQLAMRGALRREGEGWQARYWLR